MQQEIIHDVMFLSKKSVPAQKSDIKIAEDLRDTLIANRGIAIGLAANMIGKSKRIIAFYAGMLPMVMLNPTIIEKSDDYDVEEGCLSLAGMRKTKRYNNIVVEYRDLDFNKKTQEFTGLIAETIQHEVDHCNGILI
ncbi:peptide deformylase [Lactobacillus sp. LL6]|uniref:peptide deformylase n=1 Tax=Lactobacillus sp. LL6 TaxID=2596827 RepID=UPI001185FBA4|nr:peptide deformylase [Lactobacillus sp. LL6]TSO25578.1 peptide deformylase [Lactobacillus sp. LL6]